MVIGQHRGGSRASFTVRKVSFGQGVERIFPLHSPIVDEIEVVRGAKVRRAKLYLLRGPRRKAARHEERPRSRTRRTCRTRRTRVCPSPRAARTNRERHRRLGYVPRRRRG